MPGDCPLTYVATDDISASTLADNSAASIVKLEDIDIYNTIQVPLTQDFPIEDFFRVPFTHHVEIYKIANLDARYYYIHRTAEEHLPVERLEKLIKEDAYGHREQMPSNFTKTISNTEMMRKAVMMFKDSYMLDYINVEEIGVRDSIDVDAWRFFMLENFGVPEILSKFAAENKKSQGYDNNKIL